LSRILKSEDIDYEDSDEPIFCPECLIRGYQNSLGHKILIGNEPRPADYENWYECAACGLILHYVEIPKQESIKDMVETSDNPYEDQLKIVSVPTRLREQGKKLKPRGKKKDKNKLHEDPEIDALMRRHGDNLKVVFDSGSQ